jgi:ATP-dependent helicase/nuclease subunit A
MPGQLPHGNFIADAPPDMQARRAALDPRMSFAVSAPAGSGKTGLLTQRVLTLLAYCDEPEEILAITFTRKAAGEMQDRILQALWHAAEKPQPENAHARLTWELAQKVLQRDQERNWQLLSSPQRLRVQTIDSLCRSITRQLPLASGLGAQPDTLEDAGLAYRFAVRELFALLEQDSPLRDDLARLLRHLDNNLGAVESLLVALLAKREQWLQVLLQARADDARQYLEATLRQVITEHLGPLQNFFLLHQSELCAIADQAAKNLQDEPPQKNLIATLLGVAALPGITSTAVAHWQAIADLLLTNTGSYRARLTKNEGFPAGKEHASLKQRCGALIATLIDSDTNSAERLHGVRELPTAYYEDDQWQLLDSLTRLLPLLVAQLTLVFKQLGATDYSAISQAALLALGNEDEPSDIALQMDYRIRHILVDEFQDTASPQLQLLQKLTAGWQPDDGRTLFIVGDGMQSCYGFRNANVGLFLDARRNGIGSIHLTPIDLSVNFRSQVGVVKWVNETFSCAFPPDDDIGRGAVKYSHSIAFKPELPNAAVNFYGCIYVNDDDQATRENSDSDTEDYSTGRQLALEREAKTVVQLVREARASEPQGTVAILVRTRSHLAQIIPELNAAGLTWQATDIDSLASRMAIVDLSSLTRALLNPADRIAWLALLRAPWCGLDLHDLYLIANTDLGELSPRRHDTDYPVIWQQIIHHHQIKNISHSGRLCLARMMQVLQPAWNERQRKPLRQWLEGIWLALGGPATLVDANDRDNIESYFSLLEKHQEGGGIRDWQTFNNAVEKLYAAPKANADPYIHVMTIHKAKGLEFDTVIIPALDRQPRNDEHELLLWQERLDAQGERQLLLGPLAATGESHSDLYRFMRREKERQQQYEATRLLYVGCTRAVKRLHLVACLSNKNEKITTPKKSSLLASIWEQVKDQLAILPLPLQDKTIISAARNERPGLQHILRLQPQWQLPLLNDTKLLASYRGHEYRDDENIPAPESSINRLARHTGTVLHRALQVIVEKNLVAQLQASEIRLYLQRQTPFWTIQLRQLGWHGVELSQAVEKISQCLSNTLQDSRGRWLLDNSHEQSACELALYQHQDGHLRKSIIDRTFIEDGVRWIIDYKSSEPSADITVDEFIQTEVESYRIQLNRYSEAFCTLEQYKVRTALYFPFLNRSRWVEIST